MNTPHNKSKISSPYPVLFILAFFCLIFLAADKLRAAEIRKPVFAGTFYPAAEQDLRQNIQLLAAKAEHSRPAIPPDKSLKALIMPHAGYIYSGLTAAHAALVLQNQSFAKVIILAPDHRVGFTDAAVSAVLAYETPLGLIKLHADAQHLRNQTGFRAVPASDESEHSLEVILPFLQMYLGNFELVPIILGPSSIEMITASLLPLLKPDTLLVASSDLSHYLPYDAAVKKDNETIQSILDLHPGLLIKNDNRACGTIPIQILMNIARHKSWEPVLLHYSNSGDTAGDKTGVVGYTAIAFYGDTTMQENENPTGKFTESQGLALVELARQTISMKLGRNIDGKTGKKLQARLDAPPLKEKHGTFVTLHLDGQLRGCIGNLQASESIIDGIKTNAVNAAFGDPRFSPLTADELDKIDIEISILSEPKPLAYTDGRDLIAKLRPGIDGVIIRQGFRSATFLPQVWDQLARPEEFLSYLCRKAGLPTDAWQSSGLEVLTYQVQYFEEHK
ncbi:MAG: AmmeMemoRadiSam system protein B [Proteobacteria bacterium]|nr:AmmeMemoRadiSam system protein B [Pseudomonadota bacterium]MBU1708442.1 AmmeMemoRadiSam system protein B [Pseudomonadota bacterium]